MDLSAIDPSLDVTEFLALTDRSLPNLSTHQKKLLYPLYEDLKRIWVGATGFGDIIRCKCRSTKQDAAIKIITIPKNEENGVPCNIIREISALRELNHVNVVRLLDVLRNELDDVTSIDVYLVFEYLDHNLHRFLVNPLLSRSSEQIKTFLHQILSGLAYCHSHKILHRDLQPQNVLIQLHTDVVKLAHFGAARTFEVPLSSYSSDVGSPCYRAPELLFGSSNYSTPIDIWSVGCIFAEMVTGRPLFSGECVSKILVEIFCLLGTPTEETWPELSSVCNFVKEVDRPIKPKDLAVEFPDLEPVGVDLLKRMLCLCPNRRISAEEALDHPYLRSHNA